jgi:hypothetical protein
VRFSAGALAVSLVLAAGWALSTASCGGTIYVWECAAPDGADLGAANTANDPTYGDCPCKCCTHGPVNGHPYPQGDCPFADAGAGEGGPIPCSGQCWPLVPEPNWTGPLLLGVGPASNRPLCPASGDSAPVWGGYGMDTFAVACTSQASGVCADLIHVCGPEGAEGFSACVLQAGDVTCPLVPPYTNRQVFYEAPPPLSGLPTTLCCMDATPPTN